MWRPPLGCSLRLCLRDRPRTPVTLYWIRAYRKCMDGWTLWGGGNKLVTNGKRGLKS